MFLDQIEHVTLIQNSQSSTVYLCLDDVDIGQTLQGACMELSESAGAR